MLATKLFGSYVPRMHIDYWMDSISHPKLRFKFYEHHHTLFVIYNYIRSHIVMIYSIQWIILCWCFLCHDKSIHPFGHRHVHCFFLFSWCWCCCLLLTEGRDVKNGYLCTSWSSPFTLNQFTLTSQPCYSSFVMIWHYGSEYGTGTQLLPLSLFCMIIDQLTVLTPLDTKCVEITITNLIISNHPHHMLHYLLFPY